MRVAVRRLILLLPLIVLLGSLLAPIPALARAGGGNSYSGGSGGSHSYSGGSSSYSGSSHSYYGGSSSTGSGSTGSGSPTAAIVFLVLFAGIALVFWYLRQQNQSQAGTGGSVGSQFSAAPIDTQSVQTGLSALQGKDPDFNQQIFLDRAQTTFFTLQNAWMARNLQPARIYLSDGLYRTWQMQVDQQLQAHKRDVMENLVIGGMAIAQVGSDPNFDSITVKIDASCEDYDVDDRTGKMVDGSRQSKPFTEYWTFIRSAAARTRAGEQAQITQCPNCGAPVSVNESGVCAYCKATVTTGQFGWVLDRITQASEWGQAAA